MSEKSMSNFNEYFSQELVIGYFLKEVKHLIKTADLGIMEDRRKVHKTETVRSTFVRYSI